MVSNKLPNGVVPRGRSLTFTEETVPQSLLEEHSLAANRWGLLHLIEGSVVFVNLENGSEEALTAPTEFVIEPKTPHKLRPDGPFKLQIDFHFRPAAD